MRKTRYLLIAFFVIIAIIAGLMAQIITQLPDVGSIDSYLPSEATIIYSDDNEILSKIHEEENRQVVPLSKISPYLIKAVISTEDRNFYFHHGIDFGRTIRAAVCRSNGASPKVTSLNSAT